MTPEERLEKLRRLAELKGISTEAPKENGLPGWLSDLVSYGPGFLKQTGKSALNAIGELASQMPSVLGDVIGGGVFPEVDKGLKELSSQGKAAVNKALPRDTNLTPAEQKWDIATRGAAGGIFGASSLATIPTAMAAGSMAALGGDVGGTFAEKAGLPRPVGEIPGALIAGGATGFMLGPKLSPVEDDLSRASRGLTKEQIAEALAKQKILDRGGATSAVLADTLPPGSPLRSLTEKTRGSEMGNPLAIKTQGREADLIQLGQRTMDNIGPQVEPAKIATQLSDSANDFLLGQKGLRSTAIENRLAATPAPKPLEVFKLYRELASKAKDPKSPASVSAPYAQVAKELLNKDGSPITDPQRLSFQIKQLKARDANPMQQNTGGSQVAPGFLKDAIRYAEQRLGEIMPGFREAMGEFRDFTRRGPQSTQTLGDLQNSPIRRMAEANPTLEAPTPVGKLGILTAPENAPSTSAGIARLLSKPVMTQGRTVDPSAVVRGNLQMRLANDPTQIGNIIGGPMEQNIAAVLQAMGKNADDALAPARAAKELQGSFRGAPNIAEVARMHPLQAAIRLLRTADMTLTRAQQLKYAEEMGRILSRPAGEKVFAELQRLAQHDPAIRKQLSTLVPLMGMSANQE